MSQLIKARIDADLKAALLARDSFVVDTLRGLKAAILDEEVKTNARDTGLQDQLIEKILVREVKKRYEAATMYAQNDRAELAASEKAEAVVVENYLPQQLSDEELKDIVTTSAGRLEISEMSGMGRLIGDVKTVTGVRADGARVAASVKDYLQGN